MGGYSSYPFGNVETLRHPFLGASNGSGVGHFLPGRHSYRVIDLERNTIRCSSTEKSEDGIEDFNFDEKQMYVGEVVDSIGEHDRVAFVTDTGQVYHGKLGGSIRLWGKMSQNKIKLLGFRGEELYHWIQDSDGKGTVRKWNTETQALTVLAPSETPHVALLKDGNISVLERIDDDSGNWHSMIYGPQPGGTPDPVSSFEWITAPAGMQLRIERRGESKEKKLVFEVPEKGIRHEYAWSVDRAKMVTDDILLVSAIAQPGQNRVLSLINLKESEEFEPYYDIVLPGNPDTNQSAYWVHPNGNIDFLDTSSGIMKRVKVKGIHRTTIVPIDWRTENHQIEDFEPVLFTPSAHDPGLVILDGNYRGKRMQVFLRYSPDSNAIEGSISTSP